MREAYETGRGAVTMRALVHIEAEGTAPRGSAKPRKGAGRGKVCCCSESTGWTWGDVAECMAMDSRR